MLHHFLIFRAVYEEYQRSVYHTRKLSGDGPVCQNRTHRIGALALL